MLAPNKFIKSVYRLYPPFYISLISQGYRQSHIWKKYIGFSYGLYDRVNINGQYYYPKYHEIDFAKKLFTTVYEKKVFFRLKKTSLFYEKKLKEATNKDFRAFCKAFSDYMPALGIYYICDNLIEMEIYNELAKKVGSKQAKTIINSLSYPVQNNFNRQEKIDLLKTKNLKNHVKKYRWLNSRYGQPIDYTLAEAKQSLKALKQTNFFAEYKKNISQTQKAIRQAKRIINPTKRHLIDILVFFVFYRTQRTDVINRVAYEYISKLKKIARQKKLSYQNLLYCTFEEIQTKPPPITEIKKRQRDFVSVSDRQGHRLLTGFAAQKIKKLFEKSYQQVRQIFGQPAYTGIISGRVKLIKKMADISKIKHGDILVTAMTTPNMVPAMKKAKAVVTDEGGITSHAAIISRELKIPCIIGTKIATKVLKDGEKVEVDANRGVVKIIKKS